MHGVVKVRCQFCSKDFWKDRRHFNENLKLRYSFFCSKACEGKFRNKQVKLICERPECGKSFSRTPKNISPHNYCSQTCAAIINNSKYPKWPEKRCRNKVCSKMFRRTGSSYCSIECGKIGRFKYNKTDIIDILKNFYRQHRRVPAKRELQDICNKCPNIFGSWSNAVIAARLIPNRSHDHRMYKRTRTKAADGHLCDSVSEAIIDNWLTEHKIDHERNLSYPDTNHKADWAIANNQIFVEYFGLAKDSPRYDRAIRTKRKLCKQHNIRLIEIYPADLYPKPSLDYKLLNTAIDKSFQ